MPVTTKIFQHYVFSGKPHIQKIVEQICEPTSYIKNKIITSHNHQQKQVTGEKKHKNIANDYLMYYHQIGFILS